MPGSYSLNVLGGSTPIEIMEGVSTFIVGANGTGKTRLAIECERQLGVIAHRISAQRMLSIDPSVEKVNEKTARGSLRYGSGTAESDYGNPETGRDVVRWGQGRPKFILDDAGALLQVLFSEQANTAVEYLNASIDGRAAILRETTIRRVAAIFHRVLANRDLRITADDIGVVSSDATGSDGPFSVTELSDGEKSVFYIIGQTLVAEPNSVLIVDEPEIHVHRAILARLWDELEAERPDCAFLIITHDLEFAASRAGIKYVLRSYTPSAGWTVERVPEAESFSEEIITHILGSRKPVLFVEGQEGSLDAAFYRACYPLWTIVPRGSCEDVIHSVSSMRHSVQLTRIQCA